MFKLSTFGAIIALAAAAMPMAHAASPNDTRIAGPGATIVDATGAKWTLSGGYIYVNGVRDTHSAHVTFLAYENGKVWQENASHVWWWKAKSSDTWAPSSGTSNSPLLPITVKVSSSGVVVKTDPDVNVVFYGNSIHQYDYAAVTRRSDSLGNMTVPLSAFRAIGVYSVGVYKKDIYIADGGSYLVITPSNIQESDNIYEETQSNYGDYFTILDWTQFSNIDKLSLDAITSQLGNNLAYVFYNRKLTDSLNRRYVISTVKSPTTIANVQGRLFLDIEDDRHYAAVAIGIIPSATLPFVPLAGTTITINK